MTAQERARLVLGTYELEPLPAEYEGNAPCADSNRWLRDLIADAITAAVRETLEEINAAAEADMLRGNPITGAHHRAIEAKLKALRETPPLVRSEQAERLEAAFRRGVEPEELELPGPRFLRRTEPIPGQRRVRPELELAEDPVERRIEAVESYAAECFAELMAGTAEDEHAPTEAAKAACLAVLKALAVECPPDQVLSLPYIGGGGDGSLFCEWRMASGRMQLSVSSQGAALLFRARSREAASTELILDIPAGASLALDALQDRETLREVAAELGRRRD